MKRSLKIKAAAICMLLLFLVSFAIAISLIYAPWLWF